MSTTVVAGIAGAVVTSGAEVDLLAQGSTPASANGLALANSERLALFVSTTHDVTVRVYAAAGPNAGLQIVSGWTATATSTSPYSLILSGSSLGLIRVTAQAASTTAAVNCDLRAVAP